MIDNLFDQERRKILVGGIPSARNWFRSCLHSMFPSSFAVLPAKVFVTQCNASQTVVVHRSTSSCTMLLREHWWAYLLHRLASTLMPIFLSIFASFTAISKFPVFKQTACCHCDDWRLKERTNQSCNSEPFSSSSRWFWPDALVQHVTKLVQSWTIWFCQWRLFPSIQCLYFGLSRVWVIVTSNHLQPAAPGCCVSFPIKSSLPQLLSDSLSHTLLLQGSKPLILFLQNSCPLCSFVHQEWMDAAAYLRISTSHGVETRNGWSAVWQDSKYYICNCSVAYSRRHDFAKNGIGVMNFSRQSNTIVRPNHWRGWISIRGDCPDGLLSDGNALTFC